ncbi:exonuclease domain-containing protein [Thalassotalea euphylliae]|uniref:DNA polymerase III subunit epsilon n=1 Tax=Thalassotalea euphylliae TaxID=1655234 RepID=A0A3E0U392_9GAMM|nr:exonuclease domain-containing protein [Thalassotalea euphylliae]REL31184.1 DNA polymerase III subunit epsilon [Thalassotalea euphylliae]
MEQGKFWSADFFSLNPFSLNKRRERLARKVPNGTLKDFLSIPFPEPSLAIREVPLLALDFETTAMSAQSGQLLSVGFVGIEQLSIRLSSSEHYLVKPETSGLESKYSSSRSSIETNSETVVIHQITEQESQQGEPLVSVIERLLTAMAGKVMIAHYAKIEQSFLAKACKLLYGYEPIFPVIDTLALAKRRLDSKQIAYDPSELRLTNLRDSYQLPSHYAHNALNDAVATAELLLAEIAHHHLPSTPLAKLLR